MLQDAEAIHHELLAVPLHERKDSTKTQVLDIIEQWYRDNPRTTSHVAQAWVDRLRMQFKKIWFFRVTYNEGLALLMVTAIGWDRGPIASLQERG